MSLHFLESAAKDPVTLLREILQSAEHEKLESVIVILSWEEGDPEKGVGEIAFSAMEKQDLWWQLTHAMIFCWRRIASEP